MLKILMSISLLFSTNYIEENFRVDQITYSSDDATQFAFFLNVDLYSRSKDIIEMKVSFCDNEKGDCSDNYYSSVLEISNKEKTIARIPYKLEKKVFLNIIFFNENGKNKAFDIYLPVYPKNVSTCDLNKNIYCESENPSMVIYRDNVIEEKYSKLFLVNESNDLYSFENNVPFDKVKISATLAKDNGYAYMYVKEKIETFSIYYNEGYMFPLKLNSFNGITKLSFENKYYVDFINGYVYEDYYYNTVYINEIIFPYFDNQYKIFIELNDCFASFDKVLMEFNIIVRGNLIGTCGYSKYCLRRNYI